MTPEQQRYTACAVGCFLELPVPKVNDHTAIWPGYTCMMVERSVGAVKHARKTGLLPVMPIGDYNIFRTDAGVQASVIAIYTAGHICLFDQLPEEPAQKVIRGETYAMLPYKDAELVI